MALLLNAGDTVSRSYSYTQPSPLHPSQPQGTGERTGNLFDSSTIEVGGLNLNTGAEVVNNSRRRSGFIEVEASTSYSISRVIDPSAKSNFWILGYDSNKLVISDGAGTYPTVVTSFGENIAHATFTTTATTKYIRWYITLVGSYDNIMLNTGSTALPYEPFGYKIPISSAGQTTNVYLGEVESTRLVKKLILTGEEAISVDIQYNRFIFTIQDMRSEGVRLTKLFCTHYQNISDGRPIANVPNNSIYTGGGTDSQRVFIKTTDYTTDTDFKSYLAAQYAAGTPVTVWYVLATETTGIVNEPIRKIGDYADTVSGISIPTITGADSFDVLTTLKPSEVSLTYTGWHDATVKEWDGSEWS